MKAVCMSNNIIKFPQKNILNPQIISGGNSKEQVFKNEQLRVSVQLIINPNDNDISEIPLIKQIRFFISQVERPNGVKLTKAGYLPPTIVKELYDQKILKDYVIEHGITKLTKENDSNIIVLTRILGELSGLIKKRNGILTVTKKASSIVESNKLLPLIFSTFTDKFSWAFFDGYQNESIGQFGWWYSLFLISEYGNITRNSKYYAEKYFEAYPHLLTERSFDGSIDVNYSCYSVRTFERFLEYFGFTQSSENKLLDRFVKKTDLFDKFISY
jgi:hypothetical protein